MHADKQRSIQSDMGAKEGKNNNETNIWWPRGKFDENRENVFFSFFKKKKEKVYDWLRPFGRMASYENILASHCRLIILLRRFIILAFSIDWFLALFLVSVRKRYRNVVYLLQFPVMSIDKVWFKSVISHKLWPDMDSFRWWFAPYMKLQCKWRKIDTHTLAHNCQNFFHWDLPLVFQTNR